MGVGAAAISMPATGKETLLDINAFDTTTEYLHNGYDFELVFTNDIFMGLGRVRCNGISLRNNRLPMIAQVSTPEAIELVNYKLKDKIINEKGITFNFSVQIQIGDTMEWMLHTVRNRRNMSDWSKKIEDAPDTSFTMKLRPVERQIGKTTVKGFSYQYLFECASLSVYKITDRSSWEIGESAIGNEIWMRNGVVEPVKEFKDQSDFYSTEWYLDGIANPNIFQFHPLQTQFQGFTFTSSRDGTLITFPNKVAHIRSLIEKWRNSDEIVHFHEHCGDLANKFKTEQVEVFFIPGQLDRIGRANLYNQVREMVHNELHSQIGMKRERISTYGILEEWMEPDFDVYTDKYLPELLKAGVKTIFIPNQCQNDMNTWGISNMCCNVDYKISKTVGEDKLKRFCKVARTGGAKVEMWGNTAISTLTERLMHRDGKEKGIKFLPYKGSIMEVIDKSESPFVRNPSNAIEADHYTPRFCALNLRDKHIREYWMKQWKYFHDQIGLQGIFLDSSFNMSSDKFHHVQLTNNKDWSGATSEQKEYPAKFRPENEPPKLIQSQYHAHLEWVVEMQKMGYHYCAEDMGVFGINRTGPDILERVSCLSIWTDSYCDFSEEKLIRANLEPMDIFFKGLAYRMMWKLHWNMQHHKLDMGTENKVAYRLLKVFNQAESFMYNREILPGEKGVMYSNNNQAVLWSFTDFSYPLSKESKVTELIPEESQKLNEIKAQKNQVYLIQL